MTVSRRRFIHLGVTAAAGFAIAGCADDDDTAGTGVTGDTGPTTPATPTGTATSATVTATAGSTVPTAGGVLRAATLAAPADTMDPANTTGLFDYLAMFHVHDSLAVLSGGDITYQLAESIEPNDDASEWTIVLRPGATFHDGRPVTATDVAYSLRQYAASPNYGQFYALIDLANMTVVDDLTLTVPMVTPRGDLVESVFAQLSFIVPDGFTDWGRNIGSGPFRLTSYEAGVGATLERYDGYWGEPAALDGLELVAIAEPATRLNALKSGDIDYASSVPSAGAKAEAGNNDVVIARGGPTSLTMRCFALNVTQPPFDDPDVVLACKLAVDRQALIDVVLLGDGVIGNDMPSYGLAGYDDAVPQRERDVEGARQLFEAAGVDAFTIRAADFYPGIVASAEVFAQQLAEAGVTVTVEEADPTTYFEDFAAVLSTPAQGFYFINRPAVTHVSGYTGSAAAFNVTGFGTPAYDAGLAEAQATVDPAAREDRVRALLRTLHDDDGLVVWGFEEQLDAARPGVAGVELIQQVPVFWRATIT